jgi:hypothetical protein
MKWLGRLTLAVLGLFVLARAAAAQTPDYAQAGGYSYGYEAGYEAGRSEARSWTADRSGVRGEASSSSYEAGYQAEYGDAYAYASADRRGPPPPVRECDWRRAPNPNDPYACPPGWGEVTLKDSFFWGGGGVGPEYIPSGGGGGGGYAGAGAGAYAYAGASASVRVSIGGRGGGKPHKPRGGGKCGCH